MQVSYSLKSKESKFREGLVEDEIVTFVDHLIHKAITFQASDIHLEPSEKSMRVRYRIDGVLQDQSQIDYEKSLSIVSRLKVLTSLDIAEKRIPQDGKMIIKVIDDFDDQEQRDIDLRVSTFPTIYGEKMVIRILDRQSRCISLESLGCPDYILEGINKIIQHPQGFFLVTGPTGSGKSTTLYSILSQLNNPERNIVTMEDPVEYHIDGINQSQINEKIDFTFARGLRSLLRQDPDVAMVGEIRDKETAKISIEAALTGHLVLSTLHTNDSVSAVTRLIDMGVEPFLITSSLSGVIAQRLVRVLCENCKNESELSDQEKNISESLSFDLKSNFQSKGCDECFDSGHKGRSGIFEMFMIDDKIRELIMKNSGTDEIRKVAIENGMKLLKDDGLEKVKLGQISFREFLRVVS